jgi:hypothetical protein
MMSNHALQIWLTNSLLILGLLVVAVGMWMLILPQHFLKTSAKLGIWVSTEDYFNTLDKPHYQERIIYKHHRIFGVLIVLGASYTLAVLLNMDLETIRTNVVNTVNSNWMDWINSAVFILIIFGNSIAIVFGIIMFARPSMLKDIENRLNKWIPTEEKLKKLDEVHEVPATILTGKPRLCGLIVVLGGVYILLSTGGVI